MVCVKKKNKKKFSSLDTNVEEFEVKSREVKVAEKVKPKVPFHIPTIPKPQDEYKIIVNNLNQPFEHVWLDRSEDGSTFVHYLEKLSVLDFVDKNDSNVEAIKPLPIELTPFKLVEDVNELRRLASKLANLKEFAVDLEHNHYRSFQGLTCLMQISTRTEDFVIDTLKLWVHIGPYLRPVFKDPTKRKVMHGADRDILWLQRDFSIYVCNMFDTGQASRVLKMERNSLEYLLNHFCGVAANKEYQNADWRLRPLPHEMIAYAREDTHYLLYIYDMLRQKLLTSAAVSENSDPPLTEVYKRSYDICCQIYEKELLTDDSYLYIYGLQDAELNAKQLAVVSGLYEWRDGVARAEDESTGYVLPNRTLLKLAKQMPVTASKLRHCLRSKHPYIGRNIGSVVSIIKHAIQNASAFEEAVEHLKARRLEVVNEENSLADDSELSPPTTPEAIKTTDEVEIKHSYLPNDRKDTSSISSVRYVNESRVFESSNAKINTKELKSAHHSYERNGNQKSETDGCATNVPRETLHESRHPLDTPTDMKLSPAAAATVPALKKPSRAFGALFGNSAKRKYIPDKIEQQHTKLEQIKSTVSLPFHIFSGRDEQFQSSVQESPSITEVPPHMEEVPAPATVLTTEDIINIGDDSDKEESAKVNSDSASNHDINQLANNNIAGSASEIYGRDETMSLSELSSSFQKFFASKEHPKSSEMVEKSQPSMDFEPFNYAAARKQVKFGDSQRTQTVENEDNARNRPERANGKKSSVTIESQNGEEKTGVLPRGRRRQAFLASGNGSATFR